MRGRGAAGEEVGNGRLERFADLDRSESGRLFCGGSRDGFVESGVIEDESFGFLVIFCW